MLEKYKFSIDITKERKNAMEREKEIIGEERESFVAWANNNDVDVAIPDSLGGGQAIFSSFSKRDKTNKKKVSGARLNLALALGSPRKKVSKVNLPDEVK
jgi:hypothetical protein